MPVTAEQKVALVRSMGMDPSQYTTDDEGHNIVPKPSGDQPSISQGFNPKPGDDLTATPSAPHSSALGAASKSFAQAAPSAIGSGIGMWGGGALGTMVEPGIGTLIGALIGGAGAGLGTAKVQEAIEPEEWKQSVAEGQQEHPIASKIGELSSIPLSGFNPGIANIGRASGALAKLGTRLIPGAGVEAMTPTINEINALRNVGLGASVGAIQGAAIPLIQGQSPTVGGVAENALIGALFNKPNAIGKLLGFHGGEQIQTEPGAESFDANQQQQQTQPDLTTTPNEQLANQLSAYGMPIIRGLKPVRGGEAFKQTIPVTEKWRGLPESTREQEAAMEGEGGIPQNESYPNIRREEYEKALQEKSAQDLAEQRKARAEIDRQEAAQIASENAKRAIDH